MTEREACRKCSLLGTEESFCNRTIGECICKDGFFGDTCKRKLFYPITLNGKTLLFTVSKVLPHLKSPRSLHLSNSSGDIKGQS